MPKHAMDNIETTRAMRLDAGRLEIQFQDDAVGVVTARMSDVDAVRLIGQLAMALATPAIPHNELPLPRFNADGWRIKSEPPDVSSWEIRAMGD